MKPMKHTPGPWIVGTNAILGGKSGNRAVVICQTSGEDWKRFVYGEANARLIAAAPDLLEAAKHYSVCEVPDEVRHRCAGCQTAEKAITNAEGGYPEPNTQKRGNVK